MLGVPTLKDSNTDKLKISDFEIKTLHHADAIILYFSSPNTGFLKKICLEKTNRLVL